MGAVDLHTAEPGLLDDASSLAKARHQRLHLGIGQFARGGKEGLHVVPERHGRGRHGFAVQALGRLLAGVVELHPAVGIFRCCGLGPGFQRGQMGVVFDHHIAGLATGLEVDHHVAGDAQANAAIGPGLVEVVELGRGRAFAGAQGFGHG